jgi:hypothetical protein
MKLRNLLVVGAGLFAGSFLSAPKAVADIVEVEAATSCPGDLGGGLCNGSVAFSLSALLVQLSAPNSIGAGTQKYIVKDDIPGGTFSFQLTSTGQNNAGAADNGSCQINGGIAFFTQCMIVDANGRSTTKGGTAIGTGGNGNNFLFPAKITFDGSAAFGETFKLGFVSMQGSSSLLSPVPEPSTLALFGCTLLSTGIWLRKRMIGRS